MNDTLPDSVDSLIKKYEQNAILKALIQLVPFGIGSIADAALVAHTQKLRAERAYIFFDVLANSNIRLNAELIENNEFLHCFMSTSTAALRTFRHEKIRAFSQLLLSSTNSDSFSGIDDFEEYLKILDDLSYRELCILEILHKYEKNAPTTETENDLQRASEFWATFTDELTQSLSISSDEIDGIMTRLNRTGCYETFTGGYFNYTGGKGKLTPSYFRLISVISISNE